MPREIEQLTNNKNLHQGPISNKRLPPPLPAGQLPGEQSNMWLFTPKSVQQGEKFIQDDTREWFRDRDFAVEIKRQYVDHPRWIIDGGGSRRALAANANIVSEIHMLVRLHNGIPEYPEWVNAKMAIKATQSDLAYKLTKATRNTFITYGAKAMEDFAQRAPAQFIKFVAATFVPKKIEVQQMDGSGLEPDERNMLLRALADELKRREDQAFVDGTATVLDYEPQNEIVETMKELGEGLRIAAADQSIGQSKPTYGVRPEMSHGLNKVVNVIDHAAIEQDIYAAEGNGPGSVFSWED